MEHDDSEGVISVLSKEVLLQEVVRNHGVSKLGILTQLVAEENKRQEGISNFTSKLIHFLFFSFSCVTDGGEVEGRRRTGRKEEVEKWDRPGYSFSRPAATK